MMRAMVRTWLASLLLVLVVSSLACGKKKPAAENQKPPETCAEDKDCPQGWKCLAQKCANPAAGAVYTDPGHAVTPDKVRDQVQETNEQHEQNVDNAVKKAEQE